MYGFMTWNGGMVFEASQWIIYHSYHVCSHRHCDTIRFCPKVWRWGKQRSFNSPSSCVPSIKASSDVFVCAPRLPHRVNTAPNKFATINDSFAPTLLEASLGSWLRGRCWRKQQAWHLRVGAAGNFDRLKWKNTSVYQCSVYTCGTLDITSIREVLQEDSVGTEFSVLWGESH